VKPVRGTTLLDVLIALAVLTSAGAGLLAMAFVVINAHQAARQISEATTLAQAQLDQLTYAAAPPASGREEVDGRGCRSGGPCTPAGPLYQRSFTIRGERPARIQVTVEWTDGHGRPRKVVLDGQR
jgi:Tfp pilus assembly protein PilV